MSRTFGRFIKPFLKILNEENSGLGTIAVTTIGITCVATHCIYSYMTCKVSTIIVKDKLVFNRDGNSEFIVRDNNDILYNMNNSLWHWKWDSIEDWFNIKKGNKVVIKYYGWRVPLFGIFPNIVNSTNIELLMTDEKYRESQKK